MPQGYTGWVRGSAPAVGAGSFIFTTGTAAIVTAAVISLIAHFLVGAAKSLVTLRSWWSAGLEMTLAGVIVGGATYLVGLALPT
jgi:vacuolar iron transporter family protein